MHQFMQKFLRWYLFLQKRPIVNVWQVFKYMLLKTETFHYVISFWNVNVQINFWISSQHEDDHFPKMFWLLIFNLTKQLQEIW